MTYSCAMIALKCQTETTTRLSKLVPFQGELKKRTDEDIAGLAESIQNEGLLMPFAVWEHDDKHYLLDGHGRMAALIHMALHDPEILQQDLPCVIVKADTEEAARKALLQIVSICGRINPKGVLEFSSSVLDYKAPVLAKVQRKIERKAAKQVDPNADVVIKIKVKPDKVDEVKSILSQVSFIKLM